jgi:Dolichyl-phosphate-mannose-protein mannosyltransferase
VIQKRPAGRMEAALQSPALAIVTAFVLRLSLLWWIHRDRDAHQFLFSPTSHETWSVGYTMATGKGFASPLAGMQGPTAWVAPLYPAMIAFALKVFQMDRYAAVIVCLTVNCIVAALTCWPVYEIGKKIGNHRIGLASCWLWAFLPASVIFSLEWLWDPSFSAFFMALLLFWTLDLPAESSLLAWARYGLLWAVAVLMNPAIGILFPFLLLWLAQRRKQSQLPWLPKVSLVVILFLSCLAPWTARNYAAFGKLIPIKDNFGLEFWLGNNPSVKRDWSPDKHPVSVPQEMQQLIRLGEVDYMSAKQREAIEFIKSHPAVFLKSSFDRIVDTWTGLNDVPSDRWVNTLHAGTAYIWSTTAFSLLAFVGLFLVVRSGGFAIAPVWIAPIFFPVTYYITHSQLRYRHPIDPVITVLAVYALAHVGSRVFTNGESQDAPEPVPSVEIPQ